MTLRAPSRIHNDAGEPSLGISSKEVHSLQLEVSEGEAYALRPLREPPGCTLACVTIDALMCACTVMDARRSSCVNRGLLGGVSSRCASVAGTQASVADAANAAAFCHRPTQSSCPSGPGALLRRRIAASTMPIRSKLGGRCRDPPWYWEGCLSCFTSFFVTPCSARGWSWHTLSGSKSAQPTRAVW